MEKVERRKLRGDTFPARVRPPGTVPVPGPRSRSDLVTTNETTVHHPRPGFLGGSNEWDHPRPGFLGRSNKWDHPRPGFFGDRFSTYKKNWEIPIFFSRLLEGRGKRACPKRRSWETWKWLIQLDPSLERLESDSSKSRDLKVTHPSLERLESDSSKSRVTWKWLIQVLRDLKVTHQKKSTLSKPLTCEALVKVFFRRQVYSNSCTGLEKSWQGVRNTPPSPTFGVLLIPVKGLVGKEVFTLEKSSLEDGVNYSVTRGLRTG
jgi:hypothetical protein